MRSESFRAAGPLLMAVLSTCIFLSATRVSFGAPSIDDFVKEEGFLEYARLSPDGSYLAVVRPVKGVRHLVTFKITNGQLTPAGAVKLEDTRVRNIQWVNDSRMLANLRPYNPETGEHYYQKIEGKSEVRQYLPQLLAVNADGSNPVVLLSDESKFRYSLNKTNVENLLRDDPKHILMSVYVRSRDGTRDEINVYKVNVYSGDADLVEEGNHNTDTWHTDYQGNVRLRRDGPYYFGDADYIYWARPEPGGEWVEFMRHNWRDDAPFMPLAFSTQPGIIYIRTREDRDKYAIYEYDIRTRKRGKLVFAHPDVDVSGVVTATSDGQLVGATYILDKPQIAFFDKSREALANKLNGSFGKNDSVNIVSWTMDRKLMVLLVRGPRQPGVYYLFDTQSNRAMPLGEYNPDLPASSLGQMRPLTYKARDGLEIKAYFTTPPGNPSKPPLVVMPHGGPQARDMLGWDTWTQFLATRGFAVLQPNFRGSTGYGKKFEEAGYKQWGLKMQDDVTDGVKHVIEQGLVDGNRVCILGGSYGGYAALAGAAFTPELYKCAVSYNGVSELVAQLGQSREKGMAYLQHWRKSLSSVFDDAEMKKLEAASPVKHVDKIRIPIMLIAGEYDNIVEKEQSEWMASALKKAGKPHEFHLFDAEGHTIGRLKNRKKVLRLFESFLYKHIGQEAAAQ